MINLGTLNLGWPETIMILLLLVNFIKTSVNYGKFKDPDTYDYIDLWVTPAIMLGLLYWGGFFS